jgi:hypothetical protein
MKPLIVGDSFSPPRPVWDFAAGIWQSGSLRQVSSDVAAARALFKPLVKRDVEFEAEAMPTLVDGTPRLLGLLVREFTALTHYMLGAFYTEASARLRIYKQYSGLPKVQEGLATATLDECFADSCLADAFASTSVRGLSPRYIVTVTYYDNSSESFTVPLGATSISFAVRKLVKRIDVYDAAKRLQGSYAGVAGGLDDFLLGGPGTYVLLSDAPLIWDFSRARVWARARASILEVSVADQYIYAVDSELASPGLIGLRAYMAPSVFYRFFLRRWG